MNVVTTVPPLDLIKLEILSNAMRSIADETVKWLKNEAPKHGAKPWALYVGFVSPHFPLIAPPQFYALYPEERVPWPDLYEHERRPRDERAAVLVQRRELLEPRPRARLADERPQLGFRPHQVLEHRRTSSLSPRQRRRISALPVAGMAQPRFMVISASSTCRHRPGA